MAEHRIKSLNDKVSVLVFKDHYTSRTFQIPLKWVSRLGFFIGLCVLIALFATLIAVKHYHALRQGSPARVSALERELNDLRQSYQMLESTKATTDRPKDQIQNVSQELESTLEAKPVFVTNEALPAVGSLPFRINDPAANFFRGKLKVHFVIQYIATDGGNQQGRIVILAKGPKKVLWYPDEAISLDRVDSLIASSKGEYFSVSRFREVNAEFSDMGRQDDFNEVQVMIFSGTGQLIFVQKLIPQVAQPKKAKEIPNAVPRAAGGNNL